MAAAVYAIRNSSAIMTQSSRARQLVLTSVPPIARTAASAIRESWRTQDSIELECTEIRCGVPFNTNDTMSVAMMFIYLFSIC